MQIKFAMADQFQASVRKQPLNVTVADLPEAAVRKVFEYGLQRILNDSSASAKTPAEAIQLAQKRLDSLVAGEIRQSRAGGGDPVAREAMRLAVQFVKAHPSFKAWLKVNDLKATDKE